MKSVSNQMWAVIFVVLGIGCLVLACFAKQPNVQTVILSSATGLIGAGGMAFQHQSKDDPTTPPAK